MPPSQLDLNNLPFVVQVAAFSYLITNLAIIAVGVKLVRHITRMEMKVDIMWGRFERIFDIREEDKRKVQGG